MQSLRALLLTSLSWFFLTPSVAAPQDPASYGFPLNNPFEATIAGTPSALRLELPSNQHIKQADYSLNLRPKRQQRLPEIFWPVKQFHYRLAQQKQRAPLIFIISGTGSNYKSASTEHLKRLFYSAGFHVVQLSSPTSYDFITSASRSATPGISQDDAEDMYEVMLAIRAQQPQLQVSHYHLIGHSLGGLNAAFVSVLDEKRKAFEFKRVLMVNPPVSLYTSVNNLDRLVQTQVDGINSQTNYFELILGKLARYFQEKGSMAMDEAMLFDFQQSKEGLSNEQMAMLIGSVFRFAIADMVFTADLINQRGLITPLNYPIHNSTSLTPFYQRALQCDFDCYIVEQLLPYWREKYGGNSLTQLNNQISLYALSDYLKNSSKIAVMHNADDLILGPGDLGFLQKTLGSRLMLYPHGGHLGNLTYRVNNTHMLEFFRD